MKGKTWLLLILALAPALLAACGPRENCAESYDDGKTNLARICIDGEKYDFGEPIHITFTVTNISDEPLTLDGGDEPAFPSRLECPPASARWRPQCSCRACLWHLRPVATKPTP